jgi:hypothetical protein
VAALAATRASGGRVVAVGSDFAARAESAALKAEVCARFGGNLAFITPVPLRRRRSAAHHFHLPRSTLLMLVSAFAGYNAIRAAYAHAIAGRYLFSATATRCCSNRIRRRPASDAKARQVVTCAAAGRHGALLVHSVQQTRESPAGLPR